MRSVQLSFCLLLLLSCLGPIDLACADGGLTGAFSGDDDPTKDNQPAESDQTTTETKQPKPAKPELPVVSPPPETKILKNQIKFLENMKYEDVEPVRDLAEAERLINVLKRRANLLRYRNDEQSAQTVKALADYKKGMDGRWMELIKAMKDGKERTTAEWAEIATGVLGTLSDSELKVPETKDSPGEAADKETYLPTDEQLESDDPYGSLDDVDKKKEKTKAPKAKIEMPEPDLTDLIKAVRDQEKPKNMHPLTWARIVDRLELDVAEISALYAATRKKLDEQRKDELDPAMRALHNAERVYNDLKKLGKSGEAMRRHLAHRIHQADLAQLKLVISDREQMAKEREGKKSDRSLSIRTNPMAPEDTLNDIARIMEVSGTAGAPEPDAFDNMEPDGLPDLYPDDVNLILDKGIQYGKLSQIRVKRYQDSLREINERKADAENIVKRREQKLLRQKAAELRHKDRLDGKEGHPLNEAENRRTLKQMQQEMEAARQEHVEQLNAKLDAEAQEIIKLLEAEYRRRDEIAGYGKSLQPKPKSDETKADD